MYIYDYVVCYILVAHTILSPSECFLNSVYHTAHTHYYTHRHTHTLPAAAALAAGSSIVAVQCEEEMRLLNKGRGLNWQDSQKEAKSRWSSCATE